MNYQPSLFDHLTDPLRPGETPLSDYDDKTLGELVDEWRKKYKK